MMSVMHASDLTANAAAVLSLVLATIVAGFGLWLSRGDVVFAATVVWALTGIIVAAVQRTFGPMVPIVAGIAIAAVVAASWAAREPS